MGATRGVFMYTFFFVLAGAKMNPALLLDAGAVVALLILARILAKVGGRAMASSVKKTVMTMQARPIQMMRRVRLKPYTSVYLGCHSLSWLVMRKSRSRRNMKCLLMDDAVAQSLRTSISMRVISRIMPSEKHHRIAHWQT